MTTPPTSPVSAPSVAPKPPSPPSGVRPTPPPRPPQPRNVAPALAAGAAKPVQRVIKASELTPEALFQRLYFLEGVYRHHRAFIKDLTARLQRTGTAVPTMPHFDALKSAAGDIDPNVG